jgi:hypothetical protein
MGSEFSQIDNLNDIRPIYRIALYKTLLAGLTLEYQIALGRHIYLNSLQPISYDAVSILDGKITIWLWYAKYDLEGFI